MPHQATGRSNLTRLRSAQQFWPRRCASVPPVFALGECPSYRGTAGSAVESPRHTPTWIDRGGIAIYVTRSTHCPSDGATGTATAIGRLHRHYTGAGSSCARRSKHPGPWPSRCGPTDQDYGPVPSHSSHIKTSLGLPAIPESRGPPGPDPA